MKNTIRTIFVYIEPMWLGNDKQVSIRRVLACCFSLDFIRNVSYVIHHWEIGKSFADVAMLLGIEAGLITAMMSLTTITAYSKQMGQNQNTNSNTEEQ